MTLAIIKTAIPLKHTFRYRTKICFPQRTYLVDNLSSPAWFRAERRANRNFIIEGMYHPKMHALDHCLARDHWIFCSFTARPKLPVTNSFEFQIYLIIHLPVITWSVLNSPMVKWRLKFWCRFKHPLTALLENCKRFSSMSNMGKKLLYHVVGLSEARGNTKCKNGVRFKS